MKVSVIWVCALAILLWTGAQTLAQGQGQGKGKGQDKAGTPSSSEVAKPPQSVGDNSLDKAANKVGKEGKQAAEDLSAKGKDAAKDMKGKAAGAVEKGKGKGKDHQGQLQAFDKQMRHEQGKHMERQARLARIRELAVQKNDAEMIARVDKLIAKEQQVYGRKQLHLKGQNRTTGQPQAQPEGQQAPVTPTNPPAEVQTPEPAPDANGSTK